MPPPATFLRVSAAPQIRRKQAVLVACVFAACLVGIFSRPIGFLAAFWPANAIMLGILIRHPALGRSPVTWLAGLLAFIVADLITGSTVFVAISLNFANIAGVLSAWMLICKQNPKTLSFRRQRSVQVLFSACLLGTIGGAAFGALPSSLAFDVPLWHSVALWLSSEFFNYMLIVPLFMAAPKGWFWTWPASTTNWPWTHLLPLVALLCSEVFSHLIGGPGAMAFIMPAMVWCAMSYGVFPITLLNLLVCMFKTAEIALGAFSFTPENVSDVTSYRTGLALLSLAPLAVACAYSLRMQALEKLNYAVSHDFLTGALARRALMERGQKLISRLSEEGQPVAVLMLDIDHFKSVNDRFGHAQGDQVLQKFAQLARETLRPEDFLGRMGGEEFAIVLPRTNHEQAVHIGQRLCERVRGHAFALGSHSSMQITLSIGVHSAAPITAQDSIEQMLSKADIALYAAKNSGRNQLRQYVPALAPAAIQIEAVSA